MTKKQEQWQTNDSTHIETSLSIRYVHKSCHGTKIQECKLQPLLSCFVFNIMMEK